MPSIATPNILTDPGFLFRAPLGTAVPTNTVTAGVFTDAWDTAWVPLGATENGSQFTYSSTVEALRVAEFFDPVQYATTERSGRFAFNLADYTLTNWNVALNGGTLTVVSGTGATTLTKYEPPAPGEEVRCMLGWESLDGTLRTVCYQTFQGGEVQSAYAKAPQLAVIPCQFNFEVPDTGVPFSMWAAGDERG